MQRSALGQAGGRWLRYLRDDRHLSQATIRTYRSSLTCAFRTLPEEYGPGDMRDALSRRLAPDVSPHVRRSSYIVLHLFFSWLEQETGAPSPMRAMEAPPKSKARRRALTERELETLTLRLRSARPKDKAEVMLLLFEGFRLGDVVALRVEDIDVSGQRIRAHQGKGGTDYWLPLGETMLLALQVHLETAHLTTGWVFTGPYGPITTRAVSKAWVRVRGPELKGVVPHMLRHTYANLILRGQTHTDLNTLRRLMRHASLATTQLYLGEDEDAERGAIIALDRKLAAL